MEKQKIKGIAEILFVVLFFIGVIMFLFDKEIMPVDLWTFLFFASVIVIAYIEYTTPVPIPKVANDVSQTPVSISEHFTKVLNSLDLKSKNLYLNDGSHNDVIELHKRYMTTLMPGETILAVVNYKLLGGLSGRFGWSGICITECFLHCYLIQNNILAGLWPKPVKFKIPFSALESVNIGNEDGCFGMGYVGHELLLNGHVCGFLRLGTSVVPDTNLKEQLNTLFTEILKKN